MCKNSPDVPLSSCGPRTTRTRAASRRPCRPRHATLAQRPASLTPDRGTRRSTRSNYRLREATWATAHRPAIMRHNLRSLPDQCSTLLSLPTLLDITAVVLRTQCSQDRAQHCAYQEVWARS
ncbi:hypothetical protein NDU88_001615 [Pleurodeles waltl]|uniref:Uncharacterized protein n=1 Tax=Pleurodeles waltl TaxID=8319 RepID=A0AAV7LGG4_PLEWA|nr:hypothetical protein NDU88_001615 [Pleurodeles waltl]